MFRTILSTSFFFDKDSCEEHLFRIYKSPDLGLEMTKRQGQISLENSNSVIQCLEVKYLNRLYKVETR